MDQKRQYQIHIECHLGDQWFNQFDNLEIHHGEQERTILQGWMEQSTLFGILNRIRDLGIPLMAIHQVSDENSNP